MRGQALRFITSVRRYNDQRTAIMRLLSKNDSTITPPVLSGVVNLGCWPGHVTTGSWSSAAAIESKGQRGSGSSNNPEGSKRHRVSHGEEVHRRKDRHPVRPEMRVLTPVAEPAARWKQW